MAKKINWTPELMKTRICRQGHEGQWVKRPNGVVQCKLCIAEAVRRYRERGGATSPRPRSADALRNVVARLEKELGIAKKELELAEQMEILQEQYKKVREEA